MCVCGGGGVILSIAPIALMKPCQCFIQQLRRLSHCSGTCALYYNTWMRFVGRFILQRFGNIKLRFWFFGWRTGCCCRELDHTRGCFGHNTCKVTDNHYAVSPPQESELANLVLPSSLEFLTLLLISSFCSHKVLWLMRQLVWLLKNVTT